MSQNYQYNTIEEALRDLKEGKIVLVRLSIDRCTAYVRLSIDRCTATYV